MSVKTVTTITQIASDSSDGYLRTASYGGSSNADVLVTKFSLDSSARQGHIPAVTQPAASSLLGGYITRSDPEKEYWADAPENNTYGILYRHRFGWGRDNVELFDQPGLPSQAPEAAGAGWGNLDKNSGVILNERTWPSSSSSSVWQHGAWLANGPGIEDNTYYLSWSGRVLQFSIDPLLESSADIKQIPPVTGETTLTVVDFLLAALPRPNSIKNPVDTDIFIRFGTLAKPFVADSFTLYIDGVLQPTLLVEPFIGGFNITWTNTTQFKYDAEVSVRWEFSDEETPANLFVVSYQFYTVKDLAGPRIDDLVPPHGSVGISIQTTLQFEVQDFENGVNIDSLVMFVNNIKVIHGETGTLETIEYQDKTGYTVRYTHNEPWLYGDLIPVAIFIQDSSKNDNETFFSYSFTTTESTAPTLINTKPLACTVAVPVGTHVSVDIIDGGHGIDKDSIVLSVEGIERGDQVILIPILHRDE